MYKRMVIISDDATINTMTTPNVQAYGHHPDDATKLELPPRPTKNTNNNINSASGR